MANQFPCKEPGCLHTVSYDGRRPVKAGVPGAGESRKPTSKPVYLVCADGHWHSYTVTDPE